jgi:hypothetical protein
LSKGTWANLFRHLLSTVSDYSRLNFEHKFKKIYIYLVKVSPFFAPQNLIDTVRAISHNRLPNTDRAWDEIATLLQG